MTVDVKQHETFGKEGAVPNAMPGQIPLIFGVTGHRDLREGDYTALADAVRAIFRDFHARYPATPLTLLSPLAEGADRLVARVALEESVRLVVPLPMPRAFYEMDFETPESRDEFDTLLQGADEWFALPLVAETTEAELKSGTQGREWQYAQVGAYIVRHCQILLALWDGRPSKKIGSTAEVVRLRSSGTYSQALDKIVGASRRSHLEYLNSGPIFHLVTPRAGSPEVPAEAFTLRKEFHLQEDGTETETKGSHRRNAEVAEAYDRIYANLHVYNQDVARAESKPRFQRERQKSQEYLLPDAEADLLPATLRDVRLSHAVADTMARRFQQDTENTLIFLSVLVFIAAVLFEAYEIRHNPWFLLFYPLFLGLVTLGWTIGVKHSRWQDKYQDYRAFAEGLRVAFFWRLAGQNASVTDHFLSKQRSELDWIRVAIQNVLRPEQIAADEMSPEEQRRRWELVLHHWVDDQSKYFAHSAIPKNEKKLEEIERWVKGLLLGSQVIPALLALLLLPRDFPEAIRAGVEPMRHWLEAGIHEPLVVIFSALLAVTAGLLHTYADKKAFAQHLKQYKRMERIFRRASRRLTEYSADAQYHPASELILELGRESLQENGDWLLAHRERPVDVPHVG